jgi:hypothetical protein
MKSKGPALGNQGVGHRLSRFEIGGDNPCSQHLSGNTLVSDYRVNQACRLLPSCPLIGHRVQLIAPSLSLSPLLLTSQEDTHSESSPSKTCKLLSLSSLPIQREDFGYA